MPHLIIQYSENLKNIEIKKLLLKINSALFSTGLFETSEEIKSRARCDKDVVIGLNDTSQSYIHINLHLLSGRNKEQKQYLSDVLLATLTDCDIPKENGISIQACVEISEIEREFYQKIIL